MKYVNIKRSWTYTSSLPISNYPGMTPEQIIEYESETDEIDIELFVESLTDDEVEVSITDEPKYTEVGADASTSPI